MSGTPGVGFEAIADGYYLEALVVNGDDIWYTDVVLGGVRKVGADTVLLPERMMIGGLLQNRCGALLVSGSGGIHWVDPSAGTTGVLLAGLNGVNEMTADHNGGLVFGTIDLAAIQEGQKPSASTIEHLSIDGVLTRLRDNLTFANGLALAPSGNFLYFNESFSASRVFAISEQGVFADPVTLLAAPDCDGMALDAEGNIWITGFSSDFLRCVRPDGSEVRRLALPGKAATNIRFGGPDMQDLYVTVVDTASAKALAAGRLLTERNSYIFRTRSPVPGAPAPRSGFTF